MSMLRNAIDALRAAEEEWFGEEIAYVPLGGVRYEVAAVPGRTVFRQQNEYGAYVRTETRDFIVRREHLAAEPQKGDEIVYGGKTYEVLAPNGEPAECAEECDAVFRVTFEGKPRRPLAVDRTSRVAAKWPQGAARWSLLSYLCLIQRKAV